MAETKLETVYIDEDIGKDEPTQEGTENSPYKTVPFAYTQHPAAPKYLVREARGPIPDGTAAPVEREWKPAAKAALKKAAKFYETQKKKAAREKELAAQRQREEEDRAKVLEE